MGDTLGVHAGEALPQSNRLLSEASPTPLAPARPPGSACTLTPTRHLHPCWSQQVEAERATEAPEPTSLPHLLGAWAPGHWGPWLCPFQVLAMLAVYPTTTPPLQSLRKCEDVRQSMGRTGLCRVQGTHSPAEPEGASLPESPPQNVPEHKIPQHLPRLTHPPQLSLHR